MLTSKQIPEVGKGHLICVIIRFKTLLSGSITVRKWKHASWGAQLPDHFTALHDFASNQAMFKWHGWSGFSSVMQMHYALLPDLFSMFTVNAGCQRFSESQNCSCAKDIFSSDRKIHVANPLEKHMKKNYP